ncbi:universal stress protein [Desulfohalovibrio reitneri]|uniref:universal stress protein n=1 Tax=Desulfohalovibrio reitneri TaxID=1307759 RepID=UPI0004A77231|nr:universal stress protein [Desulfohalovibrio reitneri]
MEARMLHVYRNTPYGRETLLCSAHFCKKLDLTLRVYIPRHRKFLIYFPNEAMQVDLDSSYMASPDTAEERVRELLDESGARYDILDKPGFTASNLPDLPADYDFMACPRVMSEKPATIALGKIGNRVRALLKTATFPILLHASVCKPWKSVAVLFGGSENGIRSVRLGARVARLCGCPLDVFTQADKPRQRDKVEKAIDKAGLRTIFDYEVRRWHVFESGDLEENLYAVPHDSLVTLGAYGHGFIKDNWFGSVMELVQSTMPNAMLVAGPNFVVPDTDEEAAH